VCWECVAECCGELQSRDVLACHHEPFVAVCCSALECVAVWCSVLQCGAVCCSMLQCVAVVLCPRVSP